MLHTQTVTPATLELLRKLLNIPELSNFYLVGGTNLSLRYGHRKSIDIDLFTNKVFDSNELLTVLKKLFPGINVTMQKTTSLLCWLDDVKVDFVLHEYPYIREVEKIDDVTLVAVPDIIAMKLNAVAQRGAKKDFWDLTMLLEKGFTIAEMLQFYQEKYTTNDIFFVIKSLTYFEDADSKQFEQIIALDNTTWDDVKRKMTAAVKKYLDKNI